MFERETYLEWLSKCTSYLEFRPLYIYIYIYIHIYIYIYIYIRTAGTLEQWVEQQAIRTVRWLKLQIWSTFGFLHNWKSETTEQWLGPSRCASHLEGPKVCVYVFVCVCVCVCVSLSLSLSLSLSIAHAHTQTNTHTLRQAIRIARCFTFGGAKGVFMYVCVCLSLSFSFSLPLPLSLSHSTWGDWNSEMLRGGGLGSRPKKIYGERLGDGVEYHLMKPTPRR